MTNPKQRAKGRAHTLHADPYETVVGWQLFADEYDATVERMALAMWATSYGTNWLKAHPEDRKHAIYQAAVALKSIGIAAPKGRARKL